MVVNFRTRKINRDTHKLARTPTLKKKKNIYIYIEIRKLFLIQDNQSLGCRFCY